MTSAPVLFPLSTLSRTIAPEISGYRTENVPPNPQHCSTFSSGKNSAFPSPLIISTHASPPFPPFPHPPHPPPRNLKVIGHPRLSRQVQPRHIHFQPLRQKLDKLIRLRHK